MLDQNDRTTLLKLARDTLQEYLSTRRRLPFEPASPALLELRATFVTLRQRFTHELRGCRGEIEAQYPLWESVQRVSILSAPLLSQSLPATTSSPPDQRICLGTLPIV